MNIILESPEMSWSRLGSIGIDSTHVPLPYQIDPKSIQS